MDDDSVTADRGNTKYFNSVNKVITIKRNTGYRMEFETGRRSLDLPKAKSFYWRFHYTVEMQNIDFRPEGGSPGLYLKLKFNSLYKCRDHVYRGNMFFRGTTDRR